MTVSNTKKRRRTALQDGPQRRRQEEQEAVSGTKMQEIVVSRGKILELLRPDANTGKVHTLLTMEVFGIIRSLMAFRLTGGTKDYIVVGSDSGRIVILEYHPSKNMFEKIHQETFGKSGCRRIVPGQFLAVDPKGRAVMIGENFMNVGFPGGSDGPSGVLICSENYITYKNFGDQPDIRCPIPRRRNDLDDPERGMIFVCSATHKTKSMFFFLAQTEQGDIFKVTLETDEEMVTEIRLKYFDTIPVATAMCVLKTGFLFVSSEFGNHYLYQIAHLGDDDDEPEFSSAMPLEEGDTFFFQPRPLKNLVLVDEQENLSPIMSCQIADLANEDTPQLYVSCGRGPRSTLRVLRHGLEWFVAFTFWLTLFEEKPDHGWPFIHHQPNLVLCLFSPSYLCGSFTPSSIQVYPDGIRHIRADKRVNEWKTPGKKTIVRCAVNQRQVVIALTGGELVYFEMDPSGQLNEYTERKEMSADVVCMSLANVPPGEQRSRFLAVGLADNTVRIISLDPSDCLQPLSMQALPAQPESLCIVEMGGVEKQDELGDKGTIGFLYLNIGLQNGVLLRTVLDPVTGDLSDTRTRYLGSRPVKLFRVRMQGQEAVLAMSSRSWLSYSYQSRFHLTPLSYETLEYASGFASEQCPEGIVAISTNTLRILALEKLGAVFNQVAFPLQYTPRKFVIHPETNNLILIETDHNAYTEATKAQRKQQMAEEMVEAAGEDERELAAEMAAAFLNENLPEAIFGSPKAGAGQWASLVRLVNPIQGSTLDQVQLEQNEAAFSVAACRFTNTGDDWYVLVGVARDMILNPRSVGGGFIYTYRLVSGGEKLEFVHKTPVEDVPLAIAPFQGRALVGVGKLLRIYDLGKKKLLRKCENKHVPNLVTGIHTIGQRVIVSDVQESLFWVRYRRNENQLIIFADDTYPRWVTTACLLDYDTMAAADKFGNISIVRLPPNTSDDVDEDPTGNKALWDRGLLNGASQKAEIIMNYHVGETVLSLQKTTLIPGGSESLVYTTLSGGIGILVPFTSHEDHDFFQHLEMHMRSEFPPLCGRDHLSFRSYYFPVKNVIDGDLCEQFNSMDPHKQKSVAEELDRTPPEVSKKLEDIRTRYAF
ncbi:splicing factor 3B subunit 3 [Neolamprologus brichardi]|uniref:splicing factor 3B subunit 3 n=1 Tax=Neolamprologus brichardi TaxID=32507 RepID=UPI0016439E05|nr:splicing factor 3B subunit 3 [Neolamprologus brichardi]